MRWLTAVVVLIALTATPALALACRARCLDTAHGTTAQTASGHTHHASSSVTHVHQHRSDGGEAIPAAPSTIDGAHAADCLTHLDQVALPEREGGGSPLAAASTFAGRARSVHAMAHARHHDRLPLLLPPRAASPLRI